MNAELETTDSGPPRFDRGSTKQPTWSQPPRRRCGTIHVWVMGSEISQITLNKLDQRLKNHSLSGLWGH
ncbi:hypothetical protein PtB15_12B479 [Puccinia triticina]|nr:hypothetical protein PtB15_12B479 [Puccinia triticina]